MNIQGTYKVNIEHTVRRMGETENATIERMLGYLGLRHSDIPPDPDREAKIQKLIAEQQQDELATTMRLVITAECASIRSTDGDGDYPLKECTVSDDGEFTLLLEIPEADEEMQWGGRIVGDRFLVFTGESEMSDFVWERA